MPQPSVARALARIGGALALGYVTRARIATADETARRQIARRRTDLLDQTVPVLTDLGSTYAVGGAAAALALAGKRGAARDVAVAGGAAWLAAQALKLVYKRVRPYDAGEVSVMVRRPAGTSYPSGHPAVAGAVAAVLEPRLRAPARALVTRMPRFVAFSRVYVGVHYPTDVIGGLLLGRAIGDLWLRYGARKA